MAEKKNYNYYLLYIAVMIIWNALFMAAPLLAASGDDGTAGAIYKGFTPFCHQLPQRSLCVIDAPDGSRSIGDCIANWSETTEMDRYTYADPRGIAREFAVDSRDNAIYMMMLIAGLAYPFVRRVDSTDTPALWIFVLAILPLAIDGTTQLIGLRESTNTLRLVTGALAGAVVPFYAIPLMYYFIPVAKRAFLNKN